MSAERTYLSIISGQSRGLGSRVARAGLRCVEPFYAATTQARNALFDRRIKPVHDLGRPTISVGNLTTGGTGKTPVVQWLARQLIQAGHRPAVLLRGYRSHEGLSDEAALYRSLPSLEVEPDPDRVAAAARVLQRSPQTSIFLLDDAFQHRRVRRQSDLVLIDATNPFGHDHVLPRGLLREPVTGLARATVILITHADAVPDALLQRLRSLNPTAPRFQGRHVLRGLVDRNDQPVDPKTLGPVTAFAGIGNPEAFFASLRSDLHLTVAHTQRFADHEPYSPPTLDRLDALPPGPLVTTEKDWVKLAARPGFTRPVLRAALALDFADGSAPAFLAALLAPLPRPSASADPESA
ncbi:MAG: tetraacyldisaccharide 4'-kinase [Tepidisphaeraceae bacterium]